MTCTVVLLSCIGGLLQLMVSKSDSSNAACVRPADPSLVGDCPDRWLQVTLAGTTRRRSLSKRIQSGAKATALCVYWVEALNMPWFTTDITATDITTRRQNL
jgi:hypothetical protein